MNEKQCRIALPESFALVLFELLHKIENDEKFEKSENIVVNDMICQLERVLPMLNSGNYQEILNQYKKEIEKTWEL